MRILVTGCMGFIGSHVVPHLLNQGHAVIGFDNLVNPSIRPTDRMKQAAGKTWERFSFYKGDILNTIELYKVMTSYRVGAVVHLAALGSVPRSFSDPHSVTMTNVNGFVSVMTAMSSLGIERLVYASSSSVYGDDSSGFRIEGIEGKVLSPYAISKKANEDFARVWGGRQKINSVGLRFFNVYGPGQLVDSDFSAVIPRFINKPAALYGDGGTIRDFTFVGDVARAIELSLAYTEEKSAVLNVGTGNGTSLKELLTLLGKTAVQLPERLGDVRLSIASTALAEATIGFKAETEITKGLAVTKAFYEGEALRERGTAEKENSGLR